MEKLVLADNSEIEIMPGAYLGKISAIAEDFEKLKEIITDVTKPGNLDTVKFMSDNIEGAVYHNKVLTDAKFEIKKEKDRMIVSFGIREYTQKEELEKDIYTAIAYLSEEQALTVKDLYQDWDKDPVGYPYKSSNPKDTRRKYDDKLWKLKKEHDKQETRYPGADPTLWEEIVEGHSGTKEDPILVPESVTTSGFTYIYGKYYLENKNVYLCKRGGIENPESMYGQEEMLYYQPSSMVGQYFELILE